MSPICVMPLPLRCARRWAEAARPAQNAAQDLLEETGPGVPDPGLGVLCIPEDPQNQKTQGLIPDISGASGRRHKVPLGLSWALIRPSAHRESALPEISNRWPRSTSGQDCSHGRAEAYGAMQEAGPNSNNPSCRNAADTFRLDSGSHRHKIYGYVKAIKKRLDCRDACHDLFGIFR